MNKNIHLKNGIMLNYRNYCWNIRTKGITHFMTTAYDYNYLSTIAQNTLQNHIKIELIT